MRPCSPRLLAIALAVVCTSLLGACTVPADGPQDPVPTDDLSYGEGMIQVGARDAAIDFIQTYARTTTTDVDALAEIVGTPALTRWTHWVGVQNGELHGEIRGAVQISGVGPAEPIPAEPGSQGSGSPADTSRQVSLDAVVRFDATPESGEPFQLERSFQGVRVYLSNDGRWVVSDFLRDDLPFSSVFQVVDDAVVGDDQGLEVRLDSFLAAPRWQFDLVVRAPARGPALRLLPRDVRLIGPNDQVVARADVVTTSLRSIRPGKVEGIVGFQPLPTADGLSLVLGFSANGKQLPIAFDDLGELVSAVEVPTVGGGPV
jgi:hypothetical protein